MAYSVPNDIDHTVVGSILLATDQLLGVEELAVGTGTDLIDGLLCRTWLDDQSRVHRYPNPHTEGSRSTKTERGTYLPLEVSVKKVS